MAGAALPEPVIDIVPPNLVPRIWPSLADGIDKACRRGGSGQTAAWLFSECLGARSYLFAIFRDDTPVAGLVARVELRGGENVFCIQAMCGVDMSEWIDRIASHEFWPRQLQCSKAIFSGSEAYQRLVPGARVTGYNYEVDFDAGR